MTLDPHTCYRALRSHDARFDGRFYVAVRSTRIYCRPVCTVRPPKRENCRFYPSAAAAESAGFRPCLRCRPELAPGNASVDATTRLAQAAASLIEDAALEESGLEAIGDNLLIETTASGQPVTGNPGEPGFGRILQGFIENSNVDPVQEITALIAAQRASGGR